MAKKGAAKKSAAKKGANGRSPLIGHNSDHAADQDEIRKIAKAQYSLDRRKKEAMDDFRQEHRNLTARLEKLGMTRNEFREPYAKFVAYNDCDSDEDAKKAQEDAKIFLANQRRMYDALSPNTTLDWIELIQDADKIKADREAEDRRAAEEAAAAAEEPEETPAEI